MNEVMVAYVDMNWTIIAVDASTQTKPLPPTESINSEVEEDNVVVLFSIIILQPLQTKRDHIHHCLKPLSQYLPVAQIT